MRGPRAQLRCNLSLGRWVLRPMHLLKLMVAGLITAAALIGGLLVTMVVVVFGFGMAIARRWLGPPTPSRGRVAPMPHRRRQPMKQVEANDVTVTDVPMVRPEPLPQARDEG